MEKISSQLKSLKVGTIEDLFVQMIVYLVNDRIKEVKKIKEILTDRQKLKLSRFIKKDDFGLTENERKILLG